MISRVKHFGRTVVGVNNQRQIVTIVNLYACDNGDFYPPSVSYSGSGKTWNWNDPRTLSSWNFISSAPHRAMSEYLGDYLEDTDILQCPKAPYTSDYLQPAWENGDNWGNPDVPLLNDAIRGSYCYWWNYKGWLGDKKYFYGPRDSSAGAGRGTESTLMVSCYMGYGHADEPYYYGSCEKMKGASTKEEDGVDSSWWKCHKDKGVLKSIDIELHAGFTDGHVERYSPDQTVPLKAIRNRRTKEPYEDDTFGPGTFYLPKTAVE